MALNTLDHYVLPVRDIKLVLLENPKNEFGDAEVIEQNFERFVAEHPGVYDGPLIGISKNDVPTKPIDRITLNVFVGSYSQMVASQMNVGGSDFVSLGSCGLTSFQEDGERYFVFGNRKESKSIGGSIDFLPAGSFDRKDFDNGNPALECLVRELREELLVYSGGITSASMGYFFAPDFSQMAAMFISEIPALKLRDTTDFSHNGVYMIDKSNSEEHRGIYAVKEVALEDFALQHSDNIGPRNALLLNCYSEGKK
ncbi:hypothetical protein HOI26_02080 [Candidatus Woesearchaeota archaeon]|nr:hypothetical protein [Candidatus Woesearchaeota archaeon]MBT5739865.1 hypothetical protein [Candidatus Woesearchaeota archaeon]